MLKCKHCGVEINEDTMVCECGEVTEAYWEVFEKEDS